MRISRKLGFQRINCSTTALCYFKVSNSRIILRDERSNHELGTHSSVIRFVEGVDFYKPMYHLLFHQSMCGGVRFIGGHSGGWTYHDIIPQYPFDRTFILSNIVNRKGVISLKEVVDAQLVGCNRKG